MSEPIILRPELVAFAEAMELKLRKYDATLGDSYKLLTPDECMNLLVRGMERLSDSFYTNNHEKQKADAVDVGNFALFVALAVGRGK